LSFVVAPDRGRRDCSPLSKGGSNRFWGRAKTEFDFPALRFQGFIDVFFEVKGCRTLETLVKNNSTLNSVKPEDPDALSQLTETHKVPSSVVASYTVGFDGAQSRLARKVLHAEASGIPGGLAHAQEEIGIEATRRVDWHHQKLAEDFDLVAGLGREDAGNFRQRRFDGGARE